MHQQFGEKSSIQCIWPFQIILFIYWQYAYGDEENMILNIFDTRDLPAG